MIGSLIALFFLALLTFLDWLHDPRKLRVGLLLLMTTLHGLAILLQAFVTSLLSTIGVVFTDLAVWIVLPLFLAALLGVIGAAVALIINGITLLRAEGVAPAHTLSLLLGVGILGYLGAGTYTTLAGLQTALVFLLFLALPLGWLGYGLVAYVSYAAFYSRYTGRFGGPIAAVVVLGAGVPNGEVRPLLASRIRRGIEWMERDHAKGGSAVLLMSGGQGPDEPVPEGLAMARWATSQGVERSHIRVEGWSTTTEENLKNSTLVLRQEQLNGPIAVVTSSYHAFRAATLMRSLGIPGYAIGAKTARYYVPAAMLREYIAILRDNKVLNILALLVLSAPALTLAIAYLLR